METLLRRLAITILFALAATAAHAQTFTGAMSGSWWDASRGGLVPKHRGKSAVVRLLPGGGAAMLVHGQKRPWGLLFFSLLWAGFAHVFIWLAWKGGFE